MNAPKSLAEAVMRRVDADPDGELVRLVGGASWSAGELLVRSLEIARRLSGIVSAGQTVATATIRGPEAIALTTAISYLGAIELAIPDGLDEASVRRLARATNALTVVVSYERSRLEKHLQTIGSLVDYPYLLMGEESLPDAPSGPRLLELPPPSRLLVADKPELGTPTAVMTTSGTGGRPKGALLPNGAALAQAARVLRAMEYDRDDVLFNVFPWQHINARHAAFLPAVLSGARLVIGPRFSASQFWQTARAEGVTAFNFMGAVCVLLLRQSPTRFDREHQVSRAYGGPAPAWLVNETSKRFGVELRQAYACTELGDVSTTGRHVRPGAAGRPVRDYNLRITDEDGLDVPSGAPGLLLVKPRTPEVTFIEYVGEPKATQDSWRDGWFSTGDTARLDEGWLYFEGRSADVIRRRGVNISPETIEDVVMQLPGVLAAAAVGVPSELTEDEILLLVVLAEEADLDLAAVHRHCTAHLPRHAVPRFVSFEPDLPRTASQKVLRSRLRDRGLPLSAFDTNTLTAESGTGTE